MKKQILLIIIILGFITLSCSKTNDDIDREEFPKLGTCEAVNPLGNLSIASVDDDNFVYKTNGGGKMIYYTENHIFYFSHDNYPSLAIQFWGAFNNVSSSVHEFLNGKHIKDRLGNRRSFIFPDGAKITMAYADNFGPLLSVSIIEDNAYHHINFECQTVEYSSINSPYAKQLDDAEADGETSTIEFTETGLFFLNIYIEDVAGQKVEERVPLGGLYKDNPQYVDDLYDDPTQEHT